MSDITISKLVNGWSLINKIPKCVHLIGYSHSGRSTLAQLIKKYYYNNPTKGLVYEAGKYTLENIISSKSIKIQTTVPILYEANSANQEDLKILDVPCFVLSPDSKKWTAFEQKVTANFLFQKSEKAGFLIFVEQKYTRANVAPWKKVLISFLDLFNGEFTDDLLDSIGMIVTKSPPDIKQDTMNRRLQYMQSTLVKDKGVNAQLIDKLVKNIITKNRMFVMKKVNGQGSQQQQIQDLAKRLQNLPNFHIDKSRFNQLAWNPEEQKTINDYLGQSIDALESLVQTIKEVFIQTNFRIENIKLSKNKRKIDKNNDIIPNLVIKALLQTNDIRKINRFQIVKNYISFKSSIQQLNNQTLIVQIQKIIGFLIKFQIFFDQPQDLQLFQTVFQTFNFIKVTNYKQTSFQRHLEALKSLFSYDITQSILGLLIQAESSNESKQFYQKSIQFISSQQPIQPNLQQFYEKCQLKLIKYSQPKQAVYRLFAMLKQQKDKNLTVQILLQIAVFFRKANLLKDALLLFKIAKSPFHVLECYQEIINSDQTVAREYIHYLTEIYLFEQAKNVCYNMAAKFGAGSRQRFGEILKNVISQQQRYSNEPIRSNILLENIEIDATALQRIQKAVDSAISQM